MKTISITIPVPPGYRWRATNPWGEVVLFKRKPWISPDGHWETQRDELSLLSDDFFKHRIECTNWRETCRSI